MKTSDWSVRFFAELGQLLGESLKVAPNADGYASTQIGSHWLSIVGCDDDFVSVWYEPAGPGPIFDDAVTIETVQTAAAHTAWVIHSIRAADSPPV